MYSNVQSINNKVNELRAYVADTKPDVVALTETWTNALIDDECLKITDYEMVERRDRVDTAGGRGGGIIVYVRKELHAWKEEPRCAFNQYATVKLKMEKRDLSIHVVYRSPNSSNLNDEMLVEWMSGLQGKFFIVGDFNFPGIKWDMGSSCSKSRKFYEMCMETFLTQHVSEETHKSGNILDLVLSSDENMVKGIELDGKVGKSDHEIVNVDAIINVRRDDRGKQFRNVKRANFEEMRKDVNIDWEAELEEKNVNEMWEIITEKVNDAVEKHVPWCKIKKANKPKWMDNEVAKAIKEKKNAWKKWKKTKSVEEKVEYKKLETRCKKVIRNKKNAIERKIARGAKADPKAYYSYINSSKQQRSKIGPIKDEDGEFVTDPVIQANLLNNFYASVFTRSTVPPPEKERTVTNSLTDIVITEQRVMDVIDGMKEKSAPGPDQISSKIIKELKNELAKPLTILYRKSMDEAKIPDEWRRTNITPIFKNGPTWEPSNYRPVNLSCNAGKGMERLVKDGIDVHYEKNDIIGNSQHGFRRGRSPQTNLIEYLNTTTKWHDEGQNFDVIYFDFSKAFDKVDHARLMVKLKAVGIDGKVLEWIRDWLDQRKQRVVVEGSYSEWRNVLSSVIQGSVLGGVLFNTFIEDIDLVVLSLLFKFADDTKLARVVETRSEADVLQQDINNMVKWASDWEMAFNSKKCKVLHYGRGNKRHKYYMDGKELEEVEEEKDLGVWMETSLKPTRQCEAAAKNGYSAIGIIRRSFHYRTKATLLPLYKTFVRPRLEFAAAAWSPWTEQDTETLEKVQKKMVLMMCDLRGNNYEEKRKNAGLTSLKTRRIRGDLIETFKTIRGINTVNKDTWFSIQSEERKSARPTRANTVIENGEEKMKADVLIKERSRLEIRKNFYTSRVVKVWNCLPEEVKGQKTVDGFKRVVDEWLSKNHYE